jgi:cytochrome oxidase Cu insertion factor (SCO1/SenC/PrrC family)
LRNKGLLVAWLVLGGAASAELLPPERSGALLHSFTVSDDQDRRVELREVTAGAPALLLPVFTRCSGTCPLTSLLLKKALAEAKAPFRVIVFSFDAEDTAQDLRDFRERFALPAAWRLVRSGDAAATRELLDALDFHFMKSSEGFDHPNQTFVFSPKGAWAATLAGAESSRKELEAAFGRALAADDPAVLPRLRAWLIRPEAWILLACAGVAISLAAIVLARKSPRHGAAHSRLSGR